MLKVGLVEEWVSVFSEQLVRDRGYIWIKESDLKNTQRAQEEEEDKLLRVPGVEAAPDNELVSLFEVNVSRFCSCVLSGLKQDVEHNRSNFLKAELINTRLRSVSHLEKMT